MSFNKDDNEIITAPEDDFSEISDQKETSSSEKPASPAKTEGTEKKEERFCSVCRRPESKAGHLTVVGNGVFICNDCMQRGADTMNQSGFGVDAILKQLSRIPGVHLMNLGEFSGLRAEAPKTEAEPEKRFRVEEILPPHKVKAQLDRYVIGQEDAKKRMSVAVYNHYKRIINEQKRAEIEKNEKGKKIPDPNLSVPVEILKSNILMLGPTGSGKTYLVQTLARLLDVPLAITDATSLTEAGYIGDDIESVVSKLLAAAGNDVRKAEHGIIFIDEIDKIAKKRSTNQRDVSGEAVQQGMLKLLEGAEIEVPVGATSKSAMVPLKTINTKNILFICGGAFPGLEDIIKERLSKKSSIGFQADLKDRFDDDPNIMQKVTVEDLRKFGMIPEFLGRLPIIISLEKLTEDMLVRILREPQNAILKQYESLLAMDEVKLTFEEGALRVLARKALESDTGARALRQVIEEFMTDIMFEIPKDDSIGEVVITEEYLNRTGGPLIRLRG
ncbi:MAG: ATP-dependent Clp protease ATP-binding subunit ClpX [Lachnospiraceae bacterium]|nr:ATP-dependent Clp protease ATP-binding subunit ClpX [Lachnospiraceae bacterium]